MAPPFVYFSCS